MFARRTRAALLFVVVALFPVAASLPLACCAGMTDGLHAVAETTATAPESHCGGGGSCCDRAPEDAMARHCCQGGDSFERPHSPSFAPPAAVVAVTAMTEALLTVPVASLVAPSARDPIPRLEPLYTLHASLLI